jgi:putative ABC transport system substrate-binding protein
VSPLSPLLVAKRLGILHELAPKTAAIALLVNPTRLVAEVQAQEAEAAARALGRQINVLKAADAMQIDEAFATLVARGVGR